MEEKDVQNNLLMYVMLAELEKKDRVIWKTMWLIMATSIAGLILGLLAIAFLIPEGIQLLVAIILDCLIFLPSCFYALFLEISVGGYECKDCGHQVVPTYVKALFSMHMGTTRYLHCPHCGRRTWHRKCFRVNLDELEKDLKERKD